MATTQALRESYPEFIDRWPTSSSGPRCDFSTAVPVVFLAEGPSYPSGRVVLRVHPATRQVWRALAAVMLAYGYGFRETAGGTLSCRRITGGSRTTLHAHGIAGDWNPSKNRYRISAGLIQWGVQTDMPRAMVRAIEAIHLTNGRHPIEWGGRWWNVKDPMHYELDQLQKNLAPVNLASLPAGAWLAYLAFEKGSLPEGEEEMLYGLDIGKPGDDSLPDAPAHRVLQAFLVRQGQDLGTWGEHGDGVDGRPGDDTRAGLHRWKLSVGIGSDKSAGDGKVGDYELAAIYSAGGAATGPVVDQTARDAAASADKKARTAREIADTAHDSATRANRTLDKIRSE